MKFKRKEYQYAFDLCSELQRQIVALDVGSERRRDTPDLLKIDEKCHDLAFTLLLVFMGEHIPKTLWSCNDYSVLYGIIFDNEELDITEDG